MTNNVSSGNYLEQFFPASAVTDEHQLTQLRLLAKRLRIASLPQIHGMLAGGHASKQKGRGLDLDQLRLYQAGDDIRAAPVSFSSPLAFAAFVVGQRI